MSTLRSIVLVTFVAIFVGGTRVAMASSVLLLHDGWSLQSSARIQAQGEGISTAGFKPEGWYPTSVPMTVLAALVANGVYPDPFYGDNITKIPGYRPGLWLAMHEDSPFWPSWWYRTEFDLPDALKGKNLVLHLDGINYRANVWLNGKLVADDQSVVGMFRRLEFDINDKVRFGERNCLAIEVTAPGHIPDKPYHTKQIEAATGWDDHNPQPPDLNMGIWRDVAITATGPVAVRHPYVATRLDLPSLEVAHLTVSARAVNKTSNEVSGVLSGAIGNIAFQQQVRLVPKETRVVTFSPEAFPVLDLNHPRVWWPNDVGPQELYALELSFSVNGRISDTVKTRFGVREATTYINDEGWRGYMINGKRILIRGGAWMTSDMLLRLSRKRYDALIRYAREAHLNMLRSEGFSIRETEDFFDLCDQYGIMVTQQLFGRSIPDEDLAIACIEDTLLRMRNHPSLVHFLGHDETFPTNRLDQAYRDLIAKYTPERTYQPHSGAFEVNDRFKTGGTRTGTLQLWSYAGPAHYYLSKDSGAWGFAQSGGIGGVVAPVESMRRMMPEEALWPPLTKTWRLHTVVQAESYFSPMLVAIYSRYGKPAGIEDFCKKALVLNYECARGMFEAYGRNKYSATGITTWKYDAAWPASPTWQYVDWYLVAGGAYYGAKKACEPLHVLYAYDDRSVYVVNSCYRDFTGLKVAAKVYNLDMTEKWSKVASVDVPADDKMKAFAVEWPADLTKSHFLRLELEDTAGKRRSDNFYWLSTVPDIPSDYDEFFVKPKSTMDHTDLNTLPPVKLNVTSSFENRAEEQVARVAIENPSKHLAFAVRLAVTKGESGPEVAPTFWEDNFISLLPGEKRSLVATYHADDLAGAVPAVKAEGWNAIP
jgi:exo-1,4-beta-D-glucosaminidase